MAEVYDDKMFRLTSLICFFMIALSVINVVEVENNVARHIVASSSPYWLGFKVLIPWFIGAANAIAVWHAVRNGRLSKQIAGAVLISNAVMLLFVYELMARFAISR